ncbi:MAG: phospholipid carrier-dependent glycosyltransferase [Planctomycetota bacterium]
MALRPPSYLDESDASPDLTHGVPGVQWNDQDGNAEQPARLRSSNMPSDDQESYALYIALIFGIALVLRILVVLMGPMFGIENAYTEHTPHETVLAENLASDQAFGLEAQPEYTLAAEIDALRAERGELTTLEGTTLRPEFYEAPGYPAMLWAMKLTGLPMIWLLVFQCVLGALCVPLVYRIGLGLIGRKMPSAIAAAIVALHPALIFAPSTLAADTVVVLLVLLGMFGVAHAEERGFRGAIGGGLAIGGAALFSPMLAWLSPILATWMIITERRLKTFALAVLLLIGTALPVGAWVNRNIDQGMGPYVTAQPMMDRLFGTVGAAEKPIAGPYNLESNQKLMEAFKAYAALPDNAETDTFVLLDRFSLEQVTGDLVGNLTGAIQSTAPKFALDHSLDTAYARLGLEYTPRGYGAQLLGEDVASSGSQDVATEWITNGWVAFNAATVALMAVGAVLMLWRRRWAGLLLMLMVIGFYLILATANPSETLRLPLIGLQALMITAILAPGPLKVKKPKKAKVRKAKKLDELEGTRTGSPLATEESLRPAAAEPQPAAAGPVMGSGDISLKDAIHPALASAPEPEAPGTVSGDEAKDFAASIQEERLKNLATSGRPI